MTNIEDFNQKMNKTIDVFIKELGTLRTGRANSNMLDLIKVDVYGQKMPINQIGTITTPEPRTLNIQVWDLNNVALIDAAIKKSELGLNPQIDGQLIMLHIPDLSEETRNEFESGDVAAKTFVRSYPDSTDQPPAVAPANDPFADW